MFYGASLVAQMVKNPTSMQETPVHSLGREDSLEKGLAAYAVFLPWESSWTDHGISNSQTELSD